MHKTTLVWFRQDLRLDDHPALNAALNRGSVVPIYIWSPGEERPWAPGAASRWWLHHSLDALNEELKKRGSRLIIRQGSSEAILRDIAESTGADALYWNRRYEPSAVATDSALKSEFKKAGLEVETFNGNLLFEPWTIKTQANNPFQVFTPFWKACLQRFKVQDALKCPKTFSNPNSWPASQSLAELSLLPRLNWAKGFSQVWTPGELGAKAQLKKFLTSGLHHYPEDRNRPAMVGSSRLSPHLHFGEISPRQVWQAVQRQTAQNTQPGLIRGAEVYLKEIGWREFAYHLLYHFPKTPQEPLRSTFRQFPWQANKEALKRWQRGETGYPIVDAGIRELWTTGWMHNRVRMIVGSFLVKDLLLPWQEGAAWFWDTLVDSDLANNTLGWQWVTGCGADASPFYRIFNPTLQGEKFDPLGEYVRKWIPELRHVPALAVHKPWTLPSTPAGYSAPMVDHDRARTHALAAFKQLSR